MSVLSGFNPKGVTPALRKQALDSIADEAWEWFWDHAEEVIFSVSIWFWKKEFKIKDLRPFFIKFFGYPVIIPE